tara:strand:- start:747 stop:989 length:243 start_codon:yes stop_codon:yes gene_type:complete
MQGPRGTLKQQGVVAHQIMRIIASNEAMQTRELAERLGENYFRIRNEVRVLRASGLLMPKVRYLALTAAGNQVVTRLGLR